MIRKHVNLTKNEKEEMAYSIYKNKTLSKKQDETLKRKSISIFVVCLFAFFVAIASLINSQIFIFCLLIVFIIALCTYQSPFLFNYKKNYYFEWDEKISEGDVYVRWTLEDGLDYAYIDTVNYETDTYNIYHTVSINGNFSPFKLIPNVSGNKIFELNYYKVDSKNKKETILTLLKSED